MDTALAKGINYVRRFLGFKRIDRLFQRHVKVKKIKFREMRPSRPVYTRLIHQDDPFAHA